jgi:serine/threonine protein kinase
MDFREHLGTAPSGQLFCSPSSRWRARFRGAQLSYPIGHTTGRARRAPPPPSLCLWGAGGEQEGASAEQRKAMPQQPRGGTAAPSRLAEYDIQRRIGSGKFSVVYKAKRVKDSSVCALKKVQVFDIKDEKARDKCLKEVKLLEALRHEHIIRYHDSFFEEGVLFIVFEWAAGGDLKKVVREAAESKSRLDEAVIWSYFLQMSEGLAHMHDLRMMHRDIKPANVFITGSGVLKLGDMGLGRQLSQESVAAFSKVGTPLYMSPELLKGDGYDMKSDIWSLGCVLYEMCNLRSPFKKDDQNLYALFQRITACEFPPVAEAYSAELHGLVGRMIQIEAAERPDMGARMLAPWPLCTARTPHVQGEQGAVGGWGGWRTSVPDRICVVHGGVLWLWGGGGGGGGGARGGLQEVMNG